MKRNRNETGTVTAELALPQESWPRELRGVCERLDRAPAEALAAMAASIYLRAPDEERSLRELSARLARQYGLRQAVTCDGGSTARGRRSPATAAVRPAAGGHLRRRHVHHPPAPARRRGRPDGSRR
jgi:hypothetical protein